ncbi:MAG: plastocyanin/azurin family copper-binding protein [Pseudomonadota bacterium]
MQPSHIETNEGSASEMAPPRHMLTLAAAALALTLIGGTGHAGDVQEVLVVHQHTDLSAARAQHMYRFEPNVLHVEPGATVAFLNSLGDHTVRTQKGLWPEGVEPIDIAGQSRSEVSFDQPGLYGITCARHGRYGMSMIIAVGEEGLAQAAALDTDEIPATDMAREAYDALVTKLLADGS